MFRPYGILICYTKKVSAIPWITADIDKWCNGTNTDERHYEQMLEQESEELIKWKVLQQADVPLSMKVEFESLETLRRLVRRCELVSEVVNNQYDGDYAVFIEDGKRYCIRLVRREVPDLQECNPKEKGLDLDATYFDRMPTWQEYDDHVREMVSELDLYDYTGHE